VSALEKKPDYVCSFRAPSEQEYLTHKDFCKFVKAQGMDICRVLIGLEQAFLTSRGKGEITFEGDKSIFKISMQNNFNYQVAEPRRIPFSLESVKPAFRRTFSSLMVDSYIRVRASELRREFSFRDFLELDYSAFRRSVRRLKRKGLVVANPQRTTPRFFYLVEKLAEYK
jgi:hypothetical protein